MVAAVLAFAAWRISWWFSGFVRRDGAAVTLDLTATNRDFYQLLWGAAEVTSPEKFNTWPLVSELLALGARRLEVGCGLNPRLPLAGGVFVDLSDVAVGKLRAAGADARVGLLAELPVDGPFDLAAALDVVEHVEDDVGALAELARVVRPGGVLLLAVPLFQSGWTDFDDFVGHRRRYEPAELEGKLAAAGFGIERGAVYGMAPRSTWLLELGVRFLRHHPREAAREYARWIGPLGLWFQRRLVFEPGFVVGDGVDEVILVCRRTT